MTPGQKKRKPFFRMQDSHKLKRLPLKWKKPTGIDSKMRLNLKGYHRKVSPGFGSPKCQRGLDRRGLLIKRVEREQDLDGLSKDKHSAIIGSTVGMKKKAAIIKKALQMGITLLNVKDSKGFIDQVDASLKQRKEIRIKRKEKIKSEKPKKKEDKLAEKVLSEEEKINQEKKEKDRILTKKE